MTEVLWEYHKDLVELIERKRDNRTDTTELYKSVSDKLSKCISLNRTVIDISMDIAKQQLIEAFEKTGLTLGKEINDGEKEIEFDTERIVEKVYSIKELHKILEDVVVDYINETPL